MPEKGSASYCCTAGVAVGGEFEIVIVGKLSRMGASAAMTFDEPQTFTLLRLIELTPSLKERSDGDELEI